MGAIPQSSQEVVLIAQPTGPQGLTGAVGATGPQGPPGVDGTGATKTIVGPYTVQEGDGVLWVNLTFGSIPITLQSLGKNAQIWVIDYLGLATVPVAITLIGTASGSVNPTLIDLPYNAALLFYSQELDLWSYKL